MRWLSKKKVNADMVKDALGVCCVFGILIAGFWIAHGLGLPTGSDQLLQVVL